MVLIFFKVPVSNGLGVQRVGGRRSASPCIIGEAVDLMEVHREVSLATGLAVVAKWVLAN